MNQPPNVTFARFIASGFGTGWARFAPGTVASAAAILSGGLLLWISPAVLTLAIVLATAGGWLAIRHAHIEGDPGWVTIDEFAGQWLAILALPKPGALGLLLGFVLFRFFDITKLGPVGWADRKHGAFGVMADDIIAGLIVALLLTVVNFVRPHLFQ